MCQNQWFLPRSLAPCQKKTPTKNKTGIYPQCNSSGDGSVRDSGVLCRLAAPVASSLEQKMKRCAKAHFLRKTAPPDDFSFFFFLLPELEDFRPKRCRLRWHHLEAIRRASHGRLRRETRSFIHPFIYVVELANTCEYSHSGSLTELCCCCKELGWIFGFIKPQMAVAAAILDLAAGSCWKVTWSHDIQLQVHPTAELFNWNLCLRIVQKARLKKILLFSPTK